jgi:biopolymer transport protein TolR
MFSHKKNGQNGNGMNEINMTPLIDVSLVLVVMLLLATPLAFDSSIALRKSQATAQSANDKVKDERIELKLVSENSVLINRMLVTREELSNTLRPRLEESGHRKVVVICADDVSHGAFVDVLDQAKVCGASDIAITGR